jgi:hypothetical protein
VWLAWTDDKFVRRILVRNLKQKAHLEDPGVDGRILLKWILNEWSIKAWAEII